MIIVDIHEPDTIYTKLSANGLLVKREALPIGDYYFEGTEVIIERKTTNDLLNSFFNKRIWHQCYNLKQKHLKPILIIEGEIPRDYKRRNAWWNVVSTIQMRWNIPVFRTLNEDETVRAIEELFFRSNKVPKDHGRWMLKKKARRIDEAAKRLLMCLPYIGPRAAIQILKQYSPIEFFSLMPEEMSKIRGITEEKAHIISRILTYSYCRAHDTHDNH